MEVYGRNLSAIDQEQLLAITVLGLPDNTSDDELRQCLQHSLPVEAVHVEVNFDTRTILNDGFIVIRNKHFHLLNQRAIYLNGHKLSFYHLSVSPTYVEGLIAQKAAYHLPATDWPYDIRLGHPPYQFRELSDDPYDLDPLDPDKKSGHILVDDILYIIFKKFKVRELLRIERTCRRFQSVVRWILGEHQIVNLTDKTSLWGDFKPPRDMENLNNRQPITRPFFGSAFVQKILLVNFNTLEHLIINDLVINLVNVRRAILQCCPKLKHFTYHTKSIYHNIDNHAMSIIKVAVEPKSWENYQFDFDHLQKRVSAATFFDVPQCVCTDYVEEKLERSTNVSGFMEKGFPKLKVGILVTLPPPKVAERNLDMIEAMDVDNDNDNGNHDDDGYEYDGADTSDSD